MTDTEEDLVRASRPSLGLRVPVRQKGFLERLYERAKRADIKGRADMSKDELVDALRAA